MAQSKASKKTNKKSSRLDTFLSFLPFGLAVFLVLFTIVNVSVLLIKDKAFKGYEDYSEYAIKSEEKIFKKSSNYYVYFYSTSCSHCQSIKKYVFKYIDKYNENPTDDHPKLYLFCVNSDSSITGDTSNLIGFSSLTTTSDSGTVSNFTISGTPTLVSFRNRVSVSAIESSSDIATTLQS